MLTKQVEEITDGVISAKAMSMSLPSVFPCPGACHDTGADRYFDSVVPCSGIFYSAGPVLFVPKIFTAIAFDSGESPPGL